ncbi:MAG: site-2 protease family protein [Candidatus Diapherotrites archaeon]|nr:site-2 protease family protein [Candidatus Diapherotrites archaeon]
MLEVSFLDLIIFAIAQLILFWVIFGAFLRDSKNLKIWGPAVLWKFSKGLNVLDKIANAAPGLWKLYADLGVVLAFGFAGALFVFRKRSLGVRISLSILAPAILFSPFVFSLTASPLIPPFLYNIIPIMLFFFGFAVLLPLLLLFTAGSIIVNGLLLHQPVMAGAAPAIPGVYVRGSFMLIPWYGWFVFPILIFVHEMSHGILSRIGKIRVKEAGLMLLGFIPMGAFVEPDDEQLASAPLIPKLRVLAAGSMANYALALVLMLALIPVPTILQTTGINFEDYYDHPVIMDLSNGTSACNEMGKFLDHGITLIGINGNETRSMDDVINMKKSFKPNESILLQTDKGNFTVNTTNSSAIGIRMMEQRYKPMPLYVSLIWYLIKFTGLVIFFNMAIGIMNLLPLYPLDGGLMVEAFLEKKFGKHGKTVTKILAYFLLAVLLINIAPLFFVSGGGGCA